MLRIAYSGYAPVCSLLYATLSSGDRSDKNRTYNFPQNRVTDHRIGLTVHALGEIMDGDLDRLILPLIEHDTEEMLKESISL